MAWIKVESSVSRNRKFVKAGPAPSWLWLCGLAYCQEGLTDGFIPSEAIDYLGVRNGRRLAAHLVSAGLWEEVEGGWQVHDYLKHNRDAASVRDIRRERVEAGAHGGIASGEARRAKQTAKQNLEEAEANAKQPSNPAVPVAVPTAVAHLRSVQDRIEKASAAPAARAPSRPIADDRGDPEDNLEIITSLVTKEMLPLGLLADDLIEATKDACAVREIGYNSQVVRKAVDSALARAQLRKAVN